MSLKLPISKQTKKRKGKGGFSEENWNKKKFKDSLKDDN